MFSFKEKSTYIICTCALVLMLAFANYYGDFNIHKKRMENWYANTQNSMIQSNVPHRHEVNDNGRLGYYMCNSKDCKFVAPTYTEFEKFLNIFCLTD